jgi:hypothetical protein
MQSSQRLPQVASLLLAAKPRSAKAAYLLKEIKNMKPRKTSLIGTAVHDLESYSPNLRLFKNIIL